MVHGDDWRRISLRQTTANSILDEPAEIRLRCFRPFGMWQEVRRILYFELELDSGNDLAAHATSSQGFSLDRKSRVGRQADRRRDQRAGPRTGWRTAADGGCP